MKKLYAIVFIFLLATSGRAGELASSFKQAAALRAQPPAIAAPSAGLWGFDQRGSAAADSSGNDVRAAKRTLAIPPGQVPSATMMESSSQGVLDIQ